MTNIISLIRFATGKSNVLEPFSETVKALENSAVKLISSGSILFGVRSGILRRTLPVALTMIDVTVNQDMKSLTPDASIDPDYLLVTALAFNEDIRHSCAKDGTTVESLEVPTLQVYTIPLPPLAPINAASLPRSSAASR